MNDIGSFWAGGDPSPRRRVGRFDLQVVDPSLDVQVQQLGPIGEPTFALGRKSQQDILESAESAFAINGDEQAVSQRLVLNGTDETFHPAVLFA